MLPNALAMIFVAPREREDRRALRRPPRRRRRPAAPRHRVPAAVVLDRSTRPTSLFGLALLVIGTGSGLAMAPTTAMIMSAVPLSRAGMGSAVNDTAREVGGAAGIAVLGSVLATRYRSGVAVARRPPARARPAGRATAAVGQALGVADQLGGRRARRWPTPPGTPFVDAMAVTLRFGARHRARRRRGLRRPRASPSAADRRPSRRRHRPPRRRTPSPLRLIAAGPRRPNWRRRRGGSGVGGVGPPELEPPGEDLRAVGVDPAGPARMSRSSRPGAPRSAPGTSGAVRRRADRGPRRQALAERPQVVVLPELLGQDVRRRPAPSSPAATPGAAAAPGTSGPSPACAGRGAPRRPGAAEVGERRPASAVARPRPSSSAVEALTVDRPHRGRERDRVQIVGDLPLDRPRPDRSSRSAGRHAHQPGPHPAGSSSARPRRRHRTRATRRAS